MSDGRKQIARRFTYPLVVSSGSLSLHKGYSRWTRCEVSPKAVRPTGEATKRAESHDQLGSHQTALKDRGLRRDCG